MKKLVLGFLLALASCVAPAFAYNPPQSATAPITLSTSNVIACATCLTTSSNVVNTLSFGTTGLTPNSATTGAVTLSGVLIGANGGTGVANTGKTITLGGNLTTTGAGAPTLAFPASSFTYTYPLASSTLLATNGSGSSLTFGTGSLSLAGGLTTSGAFNSTFTMTGTTSVTFPTSGTLATTSQLTFASLSGQATNAQLATQTANTVLGALTATTPSGLAVPSCSAASNALIWTAGTGFGCNTAIAAATVTTNANLTGVITSVGNATAIGAQTGTGSIFVVQTSPSLITPVLGVATATSLAFSPNTGGQIGATGGAVASAGVVGEQAETDITTPTNLPTSAQYGDTCTLSLTAGDWDISYGINVVANGATLSTGFRAGIGTATGNVTTGLIVGVNAFDTGNPTAAYDQSITVPSWRVTPSTTTTYFGKIIATYSVAVPQFTCRISARRIH